MQRVAVALLIAGTLLLASWVAAGDPPARQTAAAERVDQIAPLVEDVNSQVELLRERLAVQRRFSTPRRDPFRFSPRREPVPVTPDIAVPIPEPAPPPLPQLVAILTDKTEAGVTRRAVFAVSGSVHIVKPGDVVERFVVARIDADSVELTERATSAAFRLSINK
jgi:hypothetical protein